MAAAVAATLGAAIGHLDEARCFANFGSFALARPRRRAPFLRHSAVLLERQGLPHQAVLRASIQAVKHGVLHSGALLQCMGHLLQAVLAVLLCHAYRRTCLRTLSFHLLQMLLPPHGQEISAQARIHWCMGGEVLCG